MNITRPKENTRHGFALVELLVAIGIIVILSVSLLFQQNKFDSSVQITNIAYEIATVIQQAQRYGASSVAGGFTDTDVAYGVYFEISNPKNVILFRDSDKDSQFDPAEEIQRYTISGQTNISAISTSGTSRTRVSIVFLRPDPEPSTPARIIIENDRETRTIEVSRTGQVQVKNN
ncbi:MAG: type II secretion system protein [Candidatus Paceibacterota bacterium]